MTFAYFLAKGHVKCCKGRQCGHGAVYLDSWPPVTQVYDIYGGKGLVVLDDFGQAVEQSQRNRNEMLSDEARQATFKYPCAFSKSGNTNTHNAFNPYNLLFLEILTYIVLDILLLKSYFNFSFKVKYHINMLSTKC